MFGEEESNTPNLRSLEDLVLSKPMSLVGGNVIHQLQKNFETLPTKLATISTRLEEVLASLKLDPGGGRRRDSGSQRGHSPSTQSSSS